MYGATKRTVSAVETMVHALRIYSRRKSTNPLRFEECATGVRGDELNERTYETGRLIVDC
jgi:hypothetical protein